MRSTVTNVLEKHGFTSSHPLTEQGGHKTNIRIWVETIVGSIAQLLPNTYLCFNLSKL